jgi:hypothetical protein
MHSAGNYESASAPLNPRAFQGEQMKYGQTDGVLKPVEEILLADPRWQFLAIVSPESSRPFELMDMHSKLSDIQLNANVPEGVRRQFAIACNLMLYAWFVFEFQTVAEMHAYATLELALRERFSNPTRQLRRRNRVEPVPLMLRDLLDRAVAEGLIVPQNLPVWEKVKANQRLESAESGGRQLSAAEWLQHVVRSLPNFRNDLAHGSTRLYLFASIDNLELCADIINAAFSK